MRSYIFILCPPYSGSTVLWKLIASSPNVSSLPSEGQSIPEVRDLMRTRPWSTETNLPWQEIRDVWLKYWDVSKPLLVEKSPPNLIRAQQIAKYFDPVYFVIMVRNPYAHCEGLMRRNGWNARRAAQFSLGCLKQQTMNAKELQNCIYFTYEDLTEKTEIICKRIQGLIPKIGDLDHTGRLTVESIDGAVERKIENLNNRKIYNLRRNTVNTISDEFSSAPEVMAFWGYNIYRPGPLHDVLWGLNKSRLRLRKIRTAAQKRLAGIAHGAIGMSDT